MPFGDVVVADVQHSFLLLLRPSLRKRSVASESGSTGATRVVVHNRCPLDFYRSSCRWSTPCRVCVSPHVYGVCLLLQIVHCFSCMVPGQEVSITRWVGSRPRQVSVMLMHFFSYSVSLYLPGSGFCCLHRFTYFVHKCAAIPLPERISSESFPPSVRSVSTR